jgi:formate dehydrogenase alpha subunit
MPIDYQLPDELPDEEYPFLLSTGRKLSHYNISTRFSDSLEEYAPEEYAELNPNDAERLGILDGKKIKVASRRGELETKVRVTDRVPPGMLFMTLHYKESPSNVLTNGAYDKVTKTYEYKVCGVRVESLA